MSTTRFISLADRPGEVTSPFSHAHAKHKRERERERERERGCDDVYNYIYIYINASIIDPLNIRNAH